MFPDCTIRSRTWCGRVSNR